MLGLGSLFVLLLLSLLVVQFVKLQWRRRLLPPGPIPLPIIGCLWQLKLFRPNRDVLMEVAQTYGNIYTLWFGWYPVIILNGFQAVKEGLTTHAEAVAGRPQSPVFRAMANNKGLLLATGRTWKHQRRFALMTLKTLGLGKTSLEYKMQEEVNHLIDAFRKTEGKPTNPSFALTLAVSNVVCAVVFGYRFSSDDKTFHRLLEAMECIFKFSGSLLHYLFDVLPWLMYRIPGHHRKMLASVEEVRGFIRKEISSHRAAGIPDEPQDFMYFYLAQLEKQAKDEPRPVYDEDNMIQSIYDLFLGGTETSSTTLCWGLLYMVLYPDIQAKVQKEMDAALAPGQMIYYEDRKILPYTNAVVHEVQRFSNVISIGLPRLCVKDVKVRQFHLPKNTIIFPNMASALYDPSEWETPRQFNPGHFLDQDGNFTCREAFIPFSAGNRVCIGDHLAKTELFLFLANLLKTFTFRLAEGAKGVTLEPVIWGTLQPQYFEICAVPR